MNDSVCGTKGRGDDEMRATLEAVPLSAPPHPFPVKILSVLAVILMNEALCATMLLPFIGLYVARLQGVSPDEAGFASGFLVGVFMLGQVCSGKTWGWFSDVYGRKPALRMGLFFTAIVMLLFGVSPNLPMACALRFLQGVGNGNLLVAKAMIPEVVPKIHEARGYTIVSLTWGIGSLVGPVVGGLLYDPSRYGFLHLSETGFFATFPAFLPSMSICIYGVVALLCSQALPESNPNAHPLPSFSEVLLSICGARDLPDEADENRSSLAVTNKGLSPPSVTAFSYWDAFALERTRLALILYMLIAIADIAITEILPLWMVASVPKGGLGVESDDVAIVLASSGVSVIGANIGFAKAISLVGSLERLWVIGVVLWGAFAVITPASAVHCSHPLQLVMVINGIRMTGVAWCFSSTSMLIGRAAPPGQLGSMNGIAQSCAAVVRCVTPLLAAPLFAWSINTPHFFPFDESFSIILSVVPLVATLPISARLHAVMDEYVATLSGSNGPVTTIDATSFGFEESQYQNTSPRSLGMQVEDLPVAYAPESLCSSPSQPEHVDSDHHSDPSLAYVPYQNLPQTLQQNVGDQHVRRGHSPWIESVSLMVSPGLSHEVLVLERFGCDADGIRTPQLSNLHVHHPSSLET